MMHKVELPEITKDVLSEVMEVQFETLIWAATQSQFDQQSLVDHYANQAKLTYSAEEIGNWIWRAPTTRRGPLGDFIDLPTTKPSGSKLKWVEKLKEEAEQFLGSVNVNLTSLDKNQLEKWKARGVDFLNGFYKGFNYKFDSCLFPSSQAKYNIEDFSRQDLLNNFEECNQDCAVCPACDRRGFLERTEEDVIGELDHYFPKSLYPHLSIHPYNLIPICGHCNKAFKGSKDPLQNGKGFGVKEICLPYRGQCLCKKTSLKVTTGSSPKSAKFHRINASPLLVNGQAKISIFEYLFDLPSRWSGSANRIGESMFNSLMQHLRTFFRRASVVNKKMVLDFLTELLTYWEDDYGKQENVYAKRWWLKALIHEERNQPPHQLQPAGLLEEVQRWGIQIQ